MISVLKSHPNLTEDEILFASAYICDKQLSPDKLAVVALSANRATNTGRFALTYNHDLDNAIKLQDGNLLNRLTSGENFLIEAYNSNLTPLEFRAVEKMLEKEMLATRATIDKITTLLKEGKFSEDIELFPCVTGDYGDMAPENGKSLFTNCYRDICFREEEEVMGSSNDIPMYIYAPDQVQGELLMNIFCFDFMELIKCLASSDNPINPISGKPFSKPTLEMLQSRFSKEIKMYKRYLANFKNT